MTFKTVVRIENMMLFINPKNKDLNLNYIPASPILLCVCFLTYNNSEVQSFIWTDLPHPTPLFPLMYKQSCPLPVVYSHSFVLSHLYSSLQGNFLFEI